MTSRVLLFDYYVLTTFVQPKIFLFISYKMNSSQQNSTKQLMNDANTIFSWRVPNPTLEVGEIRHSKEFSTGANKAYTWKLSLLKKLKSICCYLTLVKCRHFEIEARCSFLINQKDHRKCLHFHVDDERLLFNSDFLDLANYPIACDIKVKTVLEHVYNNEVLKKKAEQSKSTMFKNFESLLVDGKLSDVSLNVSGKTFNVHKAILTSRSTVFAAMFNNDMKENMDGIVQVDDADPVVMEEMLRFIYAGRVRNLKNIAKELLIVANKYALDELKAICANALCEKLTVNNAIEMLKFSDLHNVSDLRDLILNFIITYGKDIINTKEFTSLTKSNQDIALDIARAIAVSGIEK